MNIRRILVSQPLPSTEKSPFSELITKHEVILEFHPFIEVEGVTLKEFRKQRVEILDHTAVVMTSRTVVDHFFRICEDGRIAVPDTLKYFCISEAVANYLQKYIVYRKRKISFGTGTFAALMELVSKHKDEKFLVPLSEPHKPEIPILLQKSAIKYSKVILSHTISAKLTEIDPNSFDILALYSPADVKSYIQNFPTLERQSKIAVFGTGTARAALEAGIAVDIMAPTPTLPSMTMALDKFIGLHNQGKSTAEFALKTLPENELKSLAKTIVKKSKLSVNTKTTAK